MKDNQPTMFDDPRAIDWRGARRVDGGWEKAHGRLERRSCAVLDIGGPEWDGYGDLHGRRQALRIERERRLVKQGAGSRETAYGLTSLGAGQAGPEELAALVRRHWHIENRLHYVRDFTYDEDRCRVRVGNLPRITRAFNQRMPCPVKQQRALSWTVAERLPPDGIREHNVACRLVGNFERDCPGLKVELAHFVPTVRGRRCIELDCATLSIGDQRHLVLARHESLVGALRGIDYP